MGALAPEPTARTLATDSQKPPQSPEPFPCEIKIYSLSELVTQPWLPSLTQAVNEAFSANSGPKFAQRLSYDTQLSEEMGETGFTAVAFAPKSKYDEGSCNGYDKRDEVDIIGTASIKEWANNGEWSPYPTTSTHEASELHGANSEQDPCDGDYELGLVAVKPGANYRKRGIADSLVKACERELVRRLTLQGSKRRSIKIMIKTIREVSGPYWLKKGFKTVGVQRCPQGTWGSVEEFTLWALMRELAIE